MDFDDVAQVNIFGVCGYHIRRYC